jgi:glycosyltransferase 2 family protein
VARVTLSEPAAPAGFDLRPPGERYYRHPGDLVRLIFAAIGALCIVFLVTLARDTADGFTTDLADATGRIARAGRELLLALAQVAAIAVPAFVVVGLVVRQRWRRLATVALGGLAGAGLFGVVGRAVGAATPLPNDVEAGSWLMSPSFPPPAYLAAAVGAATVGKPWLGRPWRRGVDVGLLVLGTVLAIVGTAAVAELLLAGALGAVAGSAVLLLVGAPNRRASPAAVADALASAQLVPAELSLRRAEGGRSQLYDATLTDGRQVLVKVYGRDERDADLLYRSYRAVGFRDLEDDPPPSSLKRDVEHQAFLLMLAERAGAASPGVRAVLPAGDDGIALALDRIDGVHLDALEPASVDDRLLDAVWSETKRLHRAGIAHRALRAGNILVEPGGRPVIIDFGFAEDAASRTLRARDVAELLASLGVLVGAERSVTAATRVLGKEPVAAALPHVQPLALTSATRRRASKPLLEELRTAGAEATGSEPVELARLVRVRPRTLLMIAAGTAAFYILLPQLADVGDSVQAFGDANWSWIALTVLMSCLTYVGAGIALSGAVPVRLPFVATTATQLASSFVNRITPANVGGMALNARYLQKAGVDGPTAVAAVALDSVAGAVVHIVLLFVFFAWARQSSTTAFELPDSSKLLAALAILLALIGIVAATRWGRSFLRKKVFVAARRTLANLAQVARSPAKLVALIGGSALVTLAYVTALASSVAAFGGGPTLAQVGAVYLGAATVAAAAPTPGGLGAIEAALVAGLTGVGMDPGAAVATVLAYRLLTYWLPVLPGWVSFHVLERRGII